MIRSNRDSSITTGHWKLINSPESGLCILPYGYFGLAWSAAIMSIAVLGIVWLFADIPFNDLTAIMVIGTFSSLMLVAILAGIAVRERRLGAFLTVNEGGLHLRNDRSVLLEDFASFDTHRRDGLPGEESRHIYSLVLKCKSGEEIKVLTSNYERDVATLQQSLDQKMNDLLGR